MLHFFRDQSVLEKSLRPITQAIFPLVEIGSFVLATSPVDQVFIFILILRILILVLPIPCPLSSFFWTKESLVRCLKLFAL